MKLIRNSVFETNSSSTHSISVGNSDCYEGVTPDAENKIVLDPIEFGWGEEDYHSAMDRMAYVYIYIRDWTDSAVEKIMFKEMFDRVVKTHTDATEIVMTESQYDWGVEKGYIDHQSVEDRQLHYLFSNEATLKSFLFDTTSTLRTDNDNH